MLIEKFYFIPVLDSVLWRDLRNPSIYIRTQRKVGSFL